MPTGVRRTGLAANRPLLVGMNPRATYKALLDARLPMYREVATIEIATDDLSVGGRAGDHRGVRAVTDRRIRPRSGAATSR